MERMGKRCVTYLRVSTEMQVDGYSLAGQRTCLNRFCKREEMHIVKTYEDAGKSGKTIEGRPAFQQMINDIKSGLKVDYVVVYKLSRFGRNAADVLNSLELIQDFDVNLICVEEGIDSSQASGRLLISVLSAVAQIERENIVEQTMNGRREKARQGLWNGGMAPYGYKLEEGKLVIKEDEAKIVKYIFDKYINSDISMAGIARELNNQAITKEIYGNRLTNWWNPSGIRKIISNPTYIGKIEWGHRKMQKIHGTKLLKRVYTDTDIINSSGKHDSIIDEDTFIKAQDKRENYLKKANLLDRNYKIHLLSGLLKCPVCGNNMVAAYSKKIFVDGTNELKEYYKCGHNKSSIQDRCNHSTYYDGEALEYYVRKALANVVSNETIVQGIKQKMSVMSNGNIDDEYANYEKQIKVVETTKLNLEHQIDFELSFEDPNYQEKYDSLNKRLNDVSDKYYDMLDKLEDLKLKKQSLDNDKIKLDNIFEMLKSFDTFYDALNREERKEIYNALIDRIEVQLKDNEHPDIQLKSITFKFPIYSDHFINKKIQEDMNLNLFASISNKEDCNYVKETLFIGNCPGELYLEKYDKELGISKERTIQNGINQDVIKYVKDNYALNVNGQNIRFVRRSLGLHVRTMNKSEYVNAYFIPDIDKYNAIVEALKYFNKIPSDILTNLDQLTTKAKEQIELMKFKQNGLKFLNKKYKVILDYLKEHTDYKIDANNVLAIKSLLGFDEVVELASGQKIINKIPSYDKAVVILDALLELNIIQGDKHELSDRLQELYNTKVMHVNKKGKPNNQDIIDYVKIMYGLNVNNAMISYVRKDKGIQMKRNDSRTVTKNKVNRIPKETHYKAIIEAMEHFNMI